MSRPPVKAISPQPAKNVISFGPKSRAGFMAKPVRGPIELPITATSRPISKGCQRAARQTIAVIAQGHDHTHQNGSDDHFDQKGLTD